MRIVEFGTSSSPAFEYSSRVQEEIRSGAMYVGFDLNENMLRQIPRREGTYIALGDMKKIPLADGVADEVWVLNVFGGDFQNTPEREPDGTLVWTLGIDRHFREMTRILRPGGKIYIGEWVPRIGDPSWMKDEDYSKYGLTKQVYEGENLQEFVDQHQFCFGYIWEDTPPFFIALTKSS